MAKIVAVVLADIEIHAEMARMANVLELVEEAKQHGDEVSLVFDGAGTRWVPQLLDPQSRLHASHQAITDNVAGACACCARAFHVKAEIEKTSVKLLAEFDGHPSLRGHIASGAQIVTF